MIPDSQFGDYPRPDATAGVLTVPLKGSGYLSRLVCTLYSLTIVTHSERLSITLDNVISIIVTWNFFHRTILCSKLEDNEIVRYYPDVKGMSENGFHTQPQGGWSYLSEFCEAGVPGRDDEGRCRN